MTSAMAASSSGATARPTFSWAMSYILTV
jgi:hypothetical protein